ncbi:MAG: ABC transporter ATP-binding protein [Candidatus Hydrogenedentes bacterium]|nr:ABC transporter ATP-binding protein [Candidatus Hydrogenedentota bacterium]
MSAAAAVELCDVDKIFHTHHFFKKHEETGKRRVYYRKTVHAVDHVSLEIRPGEILGLLGRNGAGKTTTVKMISGLVKPNSGTVLVDGMDVEKKRLKVLRKIGVVLEGTRTCIWPLTPLENLSYFGNLRDVKGSMLKERSQELLDFIGLKDKMNVEVRKLSRGQKQRLAICIALITDPPVLLLDEPTTGLDVQSSRAIKDKLIEMTRQRGKCVLVTTHDMNTAQEVCDRIAIVHDGKLATCKSTRDLLGLFSDHTYHLHVDRAPDLAPIRALPGVIASDTLEDEGTGPRVSVRFEIDDRARSAALYAVMDRLQRDGVVLRSITHAQQNLEDVFLRITEKSLNIGGKS